MHHPTSRMRVAYGGTVRFDTIVESQFLSAWPCRRPDPVASGYVLVIPASAIATACPPASSSICTRESNVGRAFAVSCDLERTTLLADATRMEVCDPFVFVRGSYPETSGVRDHSSFAVVYTVSLHETHETPAHLTQWPKIFESNLLSDKLPGEPRLRLLR